MKKTVIIIIAVCVIVALGVGAYFWMAAKDNKEYYYSTGDPFVTNVLDSAKLVKTGVVLGTMGDLTDALTEQNAVLRDCILNVLRSQTEEQYQAKDLQQKLSDAIVGQLNAMFPVEEGKSPLFLRAYFTDFVMQ